MKYQKKFLSDRVLKLFSEKYNDNDTAAFNDLRHLTVLCEIVDLDQAEVHRVIKGNHKTFKSMRRTFPGLIIEGRHEIEIINIDDLYNNKCPRKIESIEFLTGGMSREMNGDRVLVHFHVLIALNNHNHNEVLSRLIEKYGMSYCVHMTKLHTNRSMTENLINIASYPIKNSYRYHLGFGYGDDKVGSYINNKSLCFRIMCDRSLVKSMKIRTNKWNDI
ncbi:hypothetical protein [Methylobacterium sp. Gmos1]